MSDEAIGSQLEGFASKLKTLVPRVAEINRDRLLYLAGQASARRHSTAWRAWAVGSTLAAAGLALMMGYSPPLTNSEIIIRWLPQPADASQPIQEIPPSNHSAVVVQKSTPSEGGERFSQSRIRRRVLEMGVDALTPTIHAESEGQESLSREEPPTVGSRTWWRPVQP